MKKRTKIVIGIVLALCIVLMSGLGLAGNYFYTLAIDAHSDKSVVFGEGENDIEKKRRWMRHSII